MNLLEYARLLTQSRSIRDGDSFRFRFARNIWWNLVGAGGSRVLTLLIGVLTARMLGKEAFGELGMVRSTTSMLGVFAGAGLGLTTTKYVAEWREQYPERAGRIIALAFEVALLTGFIVMAITVLLARPLAEKTLGAPHLWLEIVQGSLLVLVYPLGSTVTGVLAGLEDFKAIARVTILQSILAIPVTVLLILWLDLSGAVLSLTAIATVGFVLSIRPMLSRLKRAGISIHWKSSWIEKAVLWEFSLPALLSSAVASPVMWLSNAILVNQPGGYGELGLFNAAAQWRSAILFFPTLVGKVALPMLSESYGTGNRRRYLRTLWTILGIVAAGALAVAIPVIVASPQIMALYGSSFKDAQMVLILVAVVAVIRAVNTMIGYVIASVGEMWWGMLFNLMWGGTLLAFAMLWIRSYGAVGLAGAYGVAYAAHSIWQAGYMLARERRTIKPASQAKRGQ